MISYNVVTSERFDWRTVGYGPDDNERSHTTNEAIALRDLEQGVLGHAALAWEAATALSLPRLKGRPS